MDKEKIVRKIKNNIVDFEQEQEEKEEVFFDVNGEKEEQGEADECLYKSVQEMNNYIFLQVLPFKTFKKKDLEGFIKYFE